MGVNARFFGSFLSDLFSKNIKWGRGLLKTAEAGTGTELIIITGHGLSNYDFIYNATRGVIREVTWLSANELVVDEVVGQTTGDSIYYLKVRVALVKGTITLDAAAQDTLTEWADIASHEITGTNYTHGGMPLNWVGGITNYYDGTALPGGVLYLKADNVSWPDLTTDDDFKYAVVYLQGAEESSSPLIGWVSYASAVGKTAETFDIQWTDGYVGSIALSTSDPEGAFGRLWGLCLSNACQAEIDWAGSSLIKVALMQTTWSPDQDTQALWTDIAAGELEGTNYAQVELTGTAFTYDAINATPTDYGGRVDFTADDVTFPNLTSLTNYQWIVFYYDSGELPLIGYIKLATSQSAVSQDVTIEWSSTVVFRISLSTAADV